MMEAFPPLIRSRAVVLRLENVDTDVITPIARVLQGRAAVVQYAFESLRFGPDGHRLTTDPFGDPAREGAQILIAGRNFGCGSSRETAAWALRGLGLLVVVASSFGDIFYSNCLKNGVLAIRLAPDVIGDIMRVADELADIEVDLPSQRLRYGAAELSFEIGGLPKEMLLSGLDEIGMMQAREASQTAFEAQDDLRRPWVRIRRPS